MHESFRDAVPNRRPRSPAGRTLPGFLHVRSESRLCAHSARKDRGRTPYEESHALIAEGDVQERIAEKIYDLVNQLNLGAAAHFRGPEEVRAARTQSLWQGGGKPKPDAYAAASTYSQPASPFCRDRRVARSMT